MEDDLLQTNSYGQPNPELQMMQNRKKYNPYAPLPLTVAQIPIPLTNAEKINKKYQYTIVNIDSRNRDYNLFPNSNHYKISLPRPFKNIESVKLVSTEFPMMSYKICDTNNTFSFTINFDGTITEYNVEIPFGSYHHAELAKIIEQKMNEVFISTWTTIDRFLVFKVDIDYSTKQTKIRCFKQLNVNQPFDIIPTTIVVDLFDPSFQENPEKKYKMIISNANVNGIPPEDLNKEHFFTQVGLDYHIKYASNLIRSNVGGSNVKILLPFENPGTFLNISTFSLDFSSSTLGKLIGFKDDVYTGSYEYTTPIGCKEDYVLLTIPQLNTNSGDLFAKIKFDINRNTVFYNDYFVDALKNFQDTPKDQLKELELKYIDKRGNLFDFNYTEHSLTLEITEIISTLENARQSSKTKY